MKKTLPAAIVTLAAGIAGATLAAFVGIPAGALLGSTLAVAAVAAAGIRVGLPTAVRDLAFATIGVSLGAGIDETLFDRIGAWAASLAILLVALVVTIAVGRAVLVRGFGLDGRTATLASAPGTMSNAVAMAAEGHGDATAVMVLQLMRLLVLVIAVPPLAVAFDANAAGAGGLAAAMSTPVMAALLAIALALGLCGTRAGLPAASLMAGMVVSAGGHVAGVVHGAAPSWALFAAFAITGALVGARISLVTASQARHYALAGLATVATALVVSLGFAWIAQIVTGLPFAQIWIGYAPGGVEAMAAIGLALGFDPAFVAVHHFARIFALVIIVPVTIHLSRDGG